MLLSVARLLILLLAPALLLLWTASSALWSQLAFSVHQVAERPSSTLLLLHNLPGVTKSLLSSGGLFVRGLTHDNAEWGEETALVTLLPNNTLGLTTLPPPSILLPHPEGSLTPPFDVAFSLDLWRPGPHGLRFLPPVPLASFVLLDPRPSGHPSLVLDGILVVGTPRMGARLISGLPPMIGDGLKPSGVNVTAITSEVGGNATIPSSPLELKNEAPAKDESLLNSNNAPDSNPIDMSTKLVDENIHHLTDFTTGLFGKNGHQSALPGIDFGKAIPPGLSLMEVLAGLDAEEKKLVHAVLNSNELLTSPGEAKSSNLALGEIHAEGVPVSPKAGINTPSKSLSIRKPGLNLNAAPHGKDLVGDESAHKLSSPGKPQAMADEEQSFPLKPFKDTAKILVDGNESPVHRATRGIKPAPLSGTQKPNVEGLASHDLPSTDLSKLSGSKDSTENLSDKVLSPSPSHSRFKHD